MRSGKLWLIDDAELTLKQIRAQREEDSFDIEFRDVEYLVYRIDDLVEKYNQLFDGLAERRYISDQDDLEQKKIRDSSVGRLEALRLKVGKPGMSLQKAVRQFERISIDLEVEWDALPRKLDLLAAEEARKELAEKRAEQKFQLVPKKRRDHNVDRLEALRLVVGEGSKLELAEKNTEQELEVESAELIALAQAVTFTRDKHAYIASLDAANSTKIANKAHRFDKLAVISEYLAKYPTETAPMYTKQRFFKVKEGRQAKRHSTRELLQDALDVYQHQAEDLRSIHDEEFKDELESRFAELRVERRNGFKM